MPAQAPLLRDGFLALIGGQDSGLHPSLLTPTQYAFGINVLCRGGYVETRYGLKERALQFENTETQAWFEDELFQGADYFSPSKDRAYLIASVGGRIFKIDVLNDYATTEVTPVKATATTANFISPPIGSEVTVAVSENATIFPGYPVTIGSGRYTVAAKGFLTITITNLDAIPGQNILSGTAAYYLSPNPSLLPKVWMLQAENYFIIQNGSDAAIIYDGTTWRRAVRDGNKFEVPTGTAMAYWNGRIWVAVNGKEIAAGDIFGGPTTILDFTETLYLAEGGKFRVPANAGDITALKVLPVLDASLGQGPLQVHTASSISTLNLPVNRARWKDIDQPVQPIALLEYGATSQQGTVVVNGDVFFRAMDGLRTFFMSRREFQGWGNTPISREMQRIIVNDDPKYLQYGSATLFDNLLLFTVNPLPFNSGRSAYWRGLGVLDFDLISSMGKKSPPVYAGIWEGVNVLQIVKGKFQDRERCFLFVRNAENKNELWEVDPNSRFDNDGGRIKSRLETRAMDFQLPNPHNLDSARIRVDRLEGTVDFTLQFRPDQSPCWIDWDEPKQRCATVRECTPLECFEFKNFKPGYKTKIDWGQPPDDCEDFDKKPARVGYHHEFALEWEGHARIKMFQVRARIETEPLFDGCD